MTPLASLWLPILAAAVGVFIASSIIHMATVWHHGDFAAVPEQDRSRVTTTKSTIDGPIYGLVTAGVFAWLWPR